MNWSPRRVRVTRKIKIHRWFFLWGPTWETEKSGDSALLPGVTGVGRSSDTAAEMVRRLFFSETSDILLLLDCHWSYIER